MEATSYGDVREQGSKLEPQPCCEPLVIAPSIRAARLATAAVFFLCGVAAANWLVRIPAIKSELGAGAGALGLALLGTPIGSLVAMPLTGWLVARLGSRSVTLAMAVGLCFALPLPALAPGLLVLPLALFVLGGFLGALDVAMNAQAATVEHWYGRPIMSSFHAAYSIGGMVGAALGGAAAGACLSPMVHLSTIAAVLLVASALACRWLLPRDADRAFRGAGFAWPGRALAGLGFLAFGVLLAEGAMADWSAVYLHEIVGADPGWAAAGFALFSLAMAGGRLVGDVLAARWPAASLVQSGGLLAAAGLSLALLLPKTLVVLIGFAAVGAGLSFVFPLVLSAGARLPGLSPSVAIAAIATAGYLGFLIGPPVIGLGAEVTSLRVSLGFVALLCALVAARAGTLRRSSTGGR